MSEIAPVGENIFMTPLRLVGEEHIRRLVADGAAESRYLDYKRELFNGSDAEKVKLLKHVCGFSNSGGGVLVFGVEEQDGKAVRIRGVDIGEDYIERSQRLIHECIEPTLRHVEWRRVTYKDTEVLLLSVSASPDKPHIVVYKNHQRGYVRFGTDTLPMTVHEMRRMLWQEQVVRAWMPPRGNDPVNVDFLVQLHNHICDGDLQSAKDGIEEYIQHWDAEVGARDSRLNALAVDPSGRLSFSQDLEDHAFALAKCNTYFKAAVRECDKAIDTLRVARHFFADLGMMMTDTNLRRTVEGGLLRERHAADLRFADLVDELEVLLRSLRSSCGS